MTSQEKRTITYFINQELGNGHKDLANIIKFIELLPFVIPGPEVNIEKDDSGEKFVELEWFINPTQRVILEFNSTIVCKWQHDTHIGQRTFEFDKDRIPGDLLTVLLNLYSTAPKPEIA